jgi:hypothetical protein
MRGAGDYTFLDTGACRSLRQRKASAHAAIGRTSGSRNVKTGRLLRCIVTSFFGYSGVLMDIGHQLAASQDIATKVALLYRKRLATAQEVYGEQMRRAIDDNVADLVKDPAAAAGLWTAWYDYAVDAAQRSVLFWDTLRQRGNNFVEHARAGLTPVLHFAYETVVDGRKLARPVNYALVRIVKDFEALLNEAEQRAPIGELVDVMDVGFTCAFLATPYARRLSGATLYVDGGVNIMA